MKKFPARAPACSAISEQNFKIYLRIKPPLPPPRDTPSILKSHSATKIQILSLYNAPAEADRFYHYQQIFMEGSDNEQVFTDTMLAPIDNVLQGYNSTVFIYGMTGAGKTYTMFGGEGEGLVGRSVDYMFAQVEKEDAVKTEIMLSFYEIYNQSIRDLLQEEGTTAHNLQIMQDPIHGVSVTNLTEIPIGSKPQMRSAIQSGLQRRAMNATKSNQASSRSHAILQFNVRRYVGLNQTQVSVLESKFFMIDLAGNEKTAHNQSRRFIQGVNINKSLLTLGKCLSILAERKGGFVPFRDSKLTRILKQSLGGNSKTVMIACVANERKYYEQTLNTLKYSSIAKKIKNKGIRNNVKIVSKQQVGENRNYISPTAAKVSKQSKHIFVGGKQYYQLIRGLLSKYLATASHKLRIEQVQHQLQASLQQNEQLLINSTGTEADLEACRANIQCIGSTLKQLAKPYDRLLATLGSSYDEIVEMTHLHVQNSVKEQCRARDDEIRDLKQTIDRQNARIRQLEGKCAGRQQPSDRNEIENICTRRLSIDVGRSVANGVMHDIGHKDTAISVISLNSNRGINKSISRKKLTLNCISSEQSIVAVHKPLMEMSMSSLSNRQNFHAGDDRKKARHNKEIVINLSKNEKTDENNAQASNRKTNPNKQEFLRRLKQTQKKAKAAQTAQISSLLQEHQAQKYQLNNTELSMIRKLRFFQRERSQEKTHSLSKVLSRNHPATNRSAVKY